MFDMRNRDPHIGQMKDVRSPCVNICILDASGAICTGCGRTLAEIAAWGAMSALQRRAVLDRLRTARTAPGTEA